MMRTSPGGAVICAYVLCTLCVLYASGAIGADSPRLSGLYRGFPAVSQFGAAVGEAYIFTASGDVYKGWPGTQPVEKFDFARARSKEPGATGKYVVSGDKITFRWSSKESETVSFNSRRDPKTGRINTSIGSSFCYKVIPWNKPLEGTFDPSTYQGGFSRENGNPPPLVDSTTFSRDGQFTVAQDNGNPPLKGRYKVTGAALTLALPGSKDRVHSLHVFEDHKQPPTAVLIDGRPFNIQKK